MVFQEPIQKSKKSSKERTLIISSISHSGYFWGPGLVSQRSQFLKWSLSKCKRYLIPGLLKSHKGLSVATWHRTRVWRNLPSTDFFRLPAVCQPPSPLTADILIFFRGRMSLQRLAVSAGSTL